jgi:hypothetical protein
MKIRLAFVCCAACVVAGCIDPAVEELMNRHNAALEASQTNAPAAATPTETPAP